MIVLSDKPLRRAMSSLEAAGWMALWSIELSEFDIQYRPRMAIKGQVIANFIAEFTLMEGQGVGDSQQLIIHTYESSNRQAGRAGVILHSLEGDKVKYVVRLDFPITNNEEKYEALIARLDLARAVRAMDVVVYCDSQVVTSQVNDYYECKGEHMKK